MLDILIFAVDWQKIDHQYEQLFLIVTRHVKANYPTRVTHVLSLNYVCIASHIINSNF